MDFTPVLKSFSAFFSPSPLIVKAKSSFAVLILSPHPDDESIMGSLALRLKLENGARVINVGVTLGSKVDRQKERAKELKNACEHLGFEYQLLDDDWSKKFTQLKKILIKESPDLIIAPHEKDFHPVHIRTHKLLKKALLGNKKKTCLVAWSEFWAPMEKPNFLIEVPETIVKLQMEALQMHVGEVNRNPYHLRLPAWMMDNVRRGSEILSGKGKSAQSFCYGVIYRLEVYQMGKSKKVKSLEPFLMAHQDAAQMLRFILEEASGSSTKVKRG